MTPHPEAAPAEVWITNAGALEWQREVGWRSKRAGHVAYDVDGNPIRGMVPVFARRSELVAAGVDPDGPSFRHGLERAPDGFCVI